MSDGHVPHPGSVRLCFCPSASLSLLPVVSTGTCSNSFAHFTLPGHAVPPQEPAGVPRQPEAFTCLVDGRMQVKLSGFGLWELKDGLTYRMYNEKIVDCSGKHRPVSYLLTLGRAVKGFLSPSLLPHTYVHRYLQVGLSLGLVACSCSVYPRRQEKNIPYRWYESIV